MNFWDYALPLMYEKGVKQKDIADCTGHSSGRVCDWIAKKTTPRVDIALRIADKLGVSVRQLVTGEDEDMPFRLREIIELCRGLGDDELDTVRRMLQGLRKEKRDGHGSNTVAG